MVYKVEFWMHAVPIYHIPIHLPGCTQDSCATNCLDYAMKHKYNLQKSYCDKPDLCHCVMLPKQHPPLTTEVMGLADTADDNETFV